MSKVISEFGLRFGVALLPAGGGAGETRAEIGDEQCRPGRAAGAEVTVLDRHVNVAQLWRLASDAARNGEKWGQRKKCATRWQLITRGFHATNAARNIWLAELVDLLGFFDPSADWRSVETGLHMLDRADGDVNGVGAELQRLEIVPASSTKNSLFKSA